MKFVRVGVPVVALAVVLSIAGCAGASGPGAAASSSPSAATPTPSSSSAPTANDTASPAAAFDTIQLVSKQLDLLSNGKTVGSLPLTDSAQAVAALRASIGDPTILKIPVDHCAVVGKAYEWAGAIEVTDLAAAVTATTPDFSVRLLKPTIESRDGTTITLQSIDGVRVGSALPTAAQNLPFAKTADAVLLEPGWTTSTDSDIGVGAFLEDGVVVSIGSPIAVGPQAGDC